MLDSEDKTPDPVLDVVQTPSYSNRVKFAGETPGPSRRFKSKAKSTKLRYVGRKYCALCPKSFVKWAYFVKHIKLTHKITGDIPSKLLKFAIPNASSLKSKPKVKIPLTIQQSQTAAQHNSTKSLALEDRPFPILGEHVSEETPANYCHVCEREFPTRRQLCRHRYNVHRAKKRGQPQSKDVEIQDNSKIPEKSAKKRSLPQKVNIPDILSCVLHVQDHP